MEMPNRKSPRLKGYDYSTPGAYFITICVQDRRCVLSRVVGQGLAPAETELTKYGNIAKNVLLGLEERYPFLTVDCYVIMPNHIHLLISLSDVGKDDVIWRRQAAALQPFCEKPASIIDVVRAYKSLTTIECRKIGFEGKLFQSSFYDHVVRNREDYEGIFAYIEGNPSKWQDDEFYDGKQPPYEADASKRV